MLTLMLAPQAALKSVLERLIRLVNTHWRDRSSSTSDNLKTTRLLLPRSAPATNKEQTRLFWSSHPDVIAPPKPSAPFQAASFCSFSSVLLLGPVSLHRPCRARSCGAQSGMSAFSRAAERRARRPKTQRAAAAGRPRSLTGRSTSDTGRDPDPGPPQSGSECRLVR